MWDFCMSFEDGLVVTLLFGTKCKKNNCPNLQVNQKSGLFGLKNIGIKLLKSTMRLTEVPQSLVLHQFCCHKLCPDLPPAQHWHSRQWGGASEQKILNCLIRFILTEPRTEDQHRHCGTSEWLVLPFVLHNPAGLQEQMVFGSNSQILACQGMLKILAHRNLAKNLWIFLQFRHLTESFRTLPNSKKLNS